MEGKNKKALVVAVLLLALVASTIAVSTGRDYPFVGLPLTGEGAIKSELDCCNECTCNKEMTSCSCKDGVAGSCTVGCQDCHREHGYYYCRDVLDGCPEVCDDYDYDDGEARRKKAATGAFSR